MKIKNTAKKEATAMLEVVKPLGFVGTGEGSMFFRHPVIKKDLNLSGVKLEDAPKHAISWAFDSGLRAGHEAAQFSIRRAIGLE